MINNWDRFSTYLFVDRKLSTSKGNLQSYRSRYRILLEYFRNREFTRDNFNGFIQSLREKNYLNTYINQFIKTAKHLDKFLGTNQLQDYTYFQELVTPKNILTAEEITKIINLYVPYNRNCDEINYRYQCLYSVLAQTGCRIKECQLLEWRDLVAEPLSVTFRAENTKTKKTRFVPITSKLYQMLIRLPHDSKLIFHVKNRVMDTSLVNFDLHRRCKMLGIEKTDISCHCFRRSFVTLLNRSGSVPLSMIAKICGHSLETSMKYYLQTDLEEMRHALYFHPLLKENLTLDVIESKVKSVLKSLCDPARFNVEFSDSNREFKVKVWTLPSSLSSC